MAKIRELYRDKGYSVSINEKENRLLIGISGKVIDKPFENWVLDDTEYTQKVLVKEINRLKSKIVIYERMIYGEE